MPLTFPPELPAHLRRYAERGLWRDTTLAHAARALAQSQPQSILFTEGSREHTVAALLADAEALANALWDAGLRPGEVVSFQLPNWTEAAVINLACAIAGLVVTPIVPIYRDAEVAQILADSGSRLHFSAESFRGFDYAAMLDRVATQAPRLSERVLVRAAASIRPTLEAMLAHGRSRPALKLQLDPASPKLLLYTSGTTGRAKGVLHSHNTLTRFIESCQRHWHVTGGDSLLMPSPVTHITGYAFGLEMPFLARTRTVLMESWNAQQAADLIEQHAVVGTVAATPFLQELVDVAAQRNTTLPSLRFFGCGGAAVSPDLVRTANARFAQACTFRVYGCSEAPMVTLGYLGHEQGELAATTDGEVVDYEVRIVAEDGAQMPPGEAGEIQVRGPSMFLGYADAAHSRDCFTADGFFRTGDLGTLTAQRAIVVTGRKKDLIIRGGENISPKEIEDVLHRHPGIAEAAVVSMPHTRLGETVCAYVVARAGQDASAASIIAHVQGSGLARQKCPEHVELVASLPKTSSGKVRKDLLREDVRTRRGPT